MFKYEEPFGCHELYRGAMDNHNYMHHGGRKTSRLYYRLYILPTGG